MTTLRTRAAVGDSVSGNGRRRTLLAPPAADGVREGAMINPAVRKQTIQYVITLVEKAGVIITGLLALTVFLWCCLRLYQWFDEHGYF